VLFLLFIGGCGALLIFGLGSNSFWNARERAQRITGEKGTTNASPEALEKQTYIKQSIRLYDVEAKYFDSYLEKHIPGVKFKLQNTGNRSLDRVQVMVFFQDTAGKTIAEKEFNPVLVTELGSDPPLKPNYIWEMERNQYYSVKTVPSEWKEGAAKLEITDIRFSKP